jgi:hypothetical protein
VAAAGTLVVAMIVVATADDDDISSSSSFIVARMTEHLLQTLDFMLQPLRRTPLSACLIQRININFCQRINNF